jgi:hypothetical protein
MGAFASAFRANQERWAISIITRAQKAEDDDAERAAN